MRICAFCLLGSILFAAVGYLGNLISPVYQEPDFWWLSPESQEDGPTVVAVGSSHTVAIDFEELGVKGRDLGMNGADVIEAAVIARYAAAGSGARAILMPIFEDGLFFDNAGRSTRSRLSTYEMMFRHDDWRVLGDDDFGWFRWALGFIRRPDRWSGVFRELSCETHCGASREKGERWQPPDPLGRKLVDDKADRIYSLIEPRIGQREHLATVLAELERAARSATARGVSLVFFSSPVATALEQRLDETLRRNGRSTNLARTMFRDWVRAARERGLCVAYIESVWDKGSDGRNPAFYHDPHHLNSAGAREFSRRLARQMEALPACAPALAEGAADR